MEPRDRDLPTRPAPCMHATAAPGRCMAWRPGSSGV